MRIVVFGANGRVGSIVVAELLQRGHTVRAFVHGKPMFPANKQLEIVQGDIYDADSVKSAVVGSDAVISALGSWGTPKKDILTVGMQHIIPAMQQRRVKRIVSLTGADCDAAGDKPSVIHSLSRLLFGTLFGKILRDGQEHLRLLSESRLDWTIVRSPVMNARGNVDNFQLSTKRPMPWQTINRASVALVLANLAESNELAQAAPYISRSKPE